MKKLKIDLLFAAALMAGTGLALAGNATAKTVAPAYGFIDGAWEPISPTGSCATSQNNCTATALVNGQPQGVVKGTYSR